MRRGAQRGARSHRLRNKTAGGTTIRLAITSWMVLVPTVALAHPDHVSGGSVGLAHYLTEPFHVGLTGTAVVFSLWAARLFLRKFSFSRRRP